MHISSICIYQCPNSSKLYLVKVILLLFSNSNLCVYTPCVKKTSHLVTAEPPFTVKTIDWMHQTGPRILLYVTHMLCVNQVCHGVSRCVKGESCSSSGLSESRWTVLMEYLTISTNVRRIDAIIHITDDNFSFRRQRTGALCVQNSPTAAELSTNIAFK